MTSGLRTVLVTGSLRGEGYTTIAIALAVAMAEYTNRKVLLLDQEPEQSLGGQAFWSLGGLFFVDSPEQRRMRIHDSADLAWQDWCGSAGWDRDGEAHHRCLGEKLRLANQYRFLMTRPLDNKHETVDDREYSSTCLPDGEVVATQLDAAFHFAVSLN